MGFKIIISLKDFTYTYPAELIAAHPANPRDSSRLFLLNRQSKTWQHSRFKNIVDHFVAGDVLVFNNTKVFPCRLITQRKTGGRQELFLLNKIASTVEGEHWQILINASGKVRAGDVFGFDGLKIIIGDGEGNIRHAELKYHGDLFAILDSVAHMPLPPYISRDDHESDRKNYQTVYAKNTGSVAAPTAGLHFTEEIINELKNRGVIVCEVTLHVGLGTFLPVKVDDITQHKMHSEIFSIDDNTCAVLSRAKNENRRITAVGTTVARVLETVANLNVNSATTGSTDIFIYPPYNFKMIDRLITNFHQPESTLLMLVSAFAGCEFILSAYAEAINNQYRLFSYGDAMMIS